jgi:hypothetical protein
MVMRATKPPWGLFGKRVSIPRIESERMVFRVMLPWRETRQDREAGTTLLFDHFVGTGKQRCWHVKAKRMRGLEVDDKLEFGRLLDRKARR